MRTFYGVDQGDGLLYFAASERSPIGTDIYRIKLDGTGLTRLSQVDGTHRAIFNPGFTLFADVWSNVTTPSQVRLHRSSDGSEVRAIDLNPVTALRDYRLSTPEFVQVKTRDGFVMEGMLIKPPDFNPVAAISRLSVHLRRSGRLTGEEPVGRPRVHVSPDARAAWRHRLGARQPKRERQGRRITVAGVRTAWRARAAGPRGRRRVAEDSSRTSIPRAWS